MGKCGLLYTVYNNKTGLPVIVDGTAREAAEAMGIKYKSFRQAVFNERNGKSYKWTILTRHSTEELDDTTPIIDLQDDDFGAVLNCAVRYAVGRFTYMPSIVITSISPLIPFLNNKTLWCFDQDVTEARYVGGYGGSENEAEWMKFLAAVREERQKRGEELYTSWREKKQENN